MMEPMHGSDRPVARLATTIPSGRPVFRRVALLIDGTARALILPFGPTLVYRLKYENMNVDPLLWPGIVPSLATVVAVYGLGRSLGTFVADTCRPTFATSSLAIARLGGIALALHVFTYGAGLGSVRWLILIRFLSSVVAGLLCGLTSGIILEEDVLARRGSKLDLTEAVRKRESYSDLGCGTAKIYLAGFAVSILSGGLLFRSANGDLVFQGLTGGYSWSIFFLVGTAVLGELVFRTIFRLSAVSEEASLKRRPSVVFDEEVGIFGESDEDDDVASVTFLDPLIDTPARASFVSTIRSRIESATSLDEFFDCRSVCSDMDDILVDDPGMPLPSPGHLHSIARYVGGRCVYDDGEPSYVPQGDQVAVIPQCYLDCFNGNREKAKKAWDATQRWRFERQVWKIHTIPNSWFSRIKDAYPHFLHGFSKAGYPVIYEQPGRMNLKELFRNGCDIADMVHHYTFFLEYLSNCICTRPEVRSRKGPGAQPHSSSTWGFLVVMDVKGAGLSHLSGDVLRYLKQAGDTNSAHYPMSMKRAFLVNSPFWLAGAWSGIKGILPDSVQVDILSTSKFPAALREYIDEDQIPEEYAGKSPFALGEHPFEVELQALVEAAESDDMGMFSMSLSPLSGPGLRYAASASHPQRSAEPFRRRIASIDRVRSSERNSATPYSKDHKTRSPSSESNTLVLLSIVFVIFSAVQGAIEVAVPIWVLSPTSLGGLGYSPSRSGVSMFCAAMVLLWLLRSKSSRFLSRIPTKGPVQALRIGTGAESILLAALLYISSSTLSVERSDSVVVMTVTVTTLACLAVASILGRSASTVLHRIATEGFARKPEPFGLARYYGVNRLAFDCESGRLTAVLGLVGELSGVFGSLPLLSWSLKSERTAPFNGTFAFFVGSVVAFALYVCSFCLHLNSVGEFAGRHSESCRHKCLPLIGEAVAASAGDMASLLEEANWSSTPMLGGRARRRALSDASNLSSIERGEIVTPKRK